MGECNKPVKIGLSLHLIGWEGGVSFLDQSEHSEAKANECNPELLFNNLKIALTPNFQRNVW